MKFVDELPKTNRGRSKKYDYDEVYETLLKNGKAAELIQGEDFDCTGPSMRQFLYRDGAEHDLDISVRTKQDEDERWIVTFQVAKRDPNKAEKPESGKKQPAKAAA